MVNIFLVLLVLFFSSNLLFAEDGVVNYSSEKKQMSQAYQNYLESSGKISSKVTVRSSSKRYTSSKRDKRKSFSLKSSSSSFDKMAKRIESGTVSRGYSFSNMANRISKKSLKRNVNKGTSFGNLAQKIQKEKKTEQLKNNDLKISIDKKAEKSTI